MHVKQIMPGPGGGASPGISVITLLPDASPEVSCVDGYCRRWLAGGNTWLDVRGGAGNLSDHIDGAMYVEIAPFDSVNRWTQIARAVVAYDLATLPVGATVISAKIRLYVYFLRNDLGLVNPYLGAYDLALLSNTQVQNGDYINFGTTPLATPIPYSGLVVDAWCELNLNAAGLAMLIPGNVVVFGLRESTYDVADVEPTPIFARLFTVRFRTAETLAGAFQPQLVINYM